MYIYEHWRSMRPLLGPWRNHSCGRFEGLRSKKPKSEHKHHLNLIIVTQENVFCTTQTRKLSQIYDFQPGKL